MAASSNTSWTPSHDSSSQRRNPDMPNIDPSCSRTSNVVAEALERLTMAVSTAIFSKDFENPVILDNLVASFCHKCDSRQPTTFTREAYLRSVKDWATQFPLWKARVMNVSVLELDEARGYAEVLSLQHVNGLQGPDSSVQCSTVWTWRLTSGKLARGKWKAIASYSAHHPLPDDFPLDRVPEHERTADANVFNTESGIATQG